MLPTSTGAAMATTTATAPAVSRRKDRNRATSPRGSSRQRRSNGTDMATPTQKMSGFSHSATRLRSKRCKGNRRPQILAIPTLKIANANYESVKPARRRSGAVFISAGYVPAPRLTSVRRRSAERPKVRAYCAGAVVERRSISSFRCSFSRFIAVISRWSAPGRRSCSLMRSFSEFVLAAELIEVGRDAHRRPPAASILPAHGAPFGEFVTKGLWPSC